MPRRQRTSVPEEPELFEDDESLPEELEVEVEDEGEVQANHWHYAGRRALMCGLTAPGYTQAVARRCDYG